MNLGEEIINKWPELVNHKGIMFHYVKALPHTSLLTRQKLLELRWKLMSLPSYNPELTPSDCHLYRSSHGK